ncbi:trypsin-like serine peptidase [Xanthobacteraceae bacterium A53D]
MLPAPARAQSVGFNPADYGKAQLPMRQSTGDASTYIDANKGAFEPIAELDPGDPLAALAKPIGRVDIVLRNRKTGAEVGVSCTGELLPGDHVLTNHHCLPQEGDLTPVKASILMDYVTLDGKGARRFELDTRPVEWNAKLDYAIARVSGDPAATYGTVKIAAAPAGTSRSLMVIHHPMGRPKVMSRFRCMALKQQDADGGELRHRCDTLGGSSGSLLFDGRSLGVALHKEGGLDPADPSSYNTATGMAALLEASPILKALASEDAEPPAGEAPPDEAPVASDRQPGSAATAPGGNAADTATMNSILRSP